METIKEMADRLKKERYSEGYSAGYQTGMDYAEGKIHSVVALGESKSTAYREGWRDGFSKAQQSASATVATYTYAGPDILTDPRVFPQGEE